MNYIYDITLNFNKALYNFYEWENDDCVEFYLKIPIFKVEDSTINDFINSSIIINKEILNKINNKTECYSKAKLKIPKYAAVFSSLEKTIAIVFNEKGESIKKSYLSIDEEEDILEFTKLIKYSLIDYKIKNKINSNNFMTRNELKNKKELLDLLDEIKKNNELSKLKYIFYEVYNEKEENENRIYSKLTNLIMNNSEKVDKLKNIFNELSLERKKV